MEEAWCLFLEKVGHGLALPPKVKDIARSVAKECVGLPHAITVLAGSMRGMDDTGGSGNLSFPFLSLLHVWLLRKNSGGKKI